MIGPCLESHLSKGPFTSIYNFQCIKVMFTSKKHQPLKKKSGHQVPKPQKISAKCHATVIAGSTYHVRFTLGARTPSMPWWVWPENGTALVTGNGWKRYPPGKEHTQVWLGLGKMITYSLKCTRTDPKWSEWFISEHPVQSSWEHNRNQTFVVNLDWNVNGSIAEIQHEEWRCWKSQFFLAISMVSLTIQTQVSGISATTPIKSKHSATNMCANPYLRRLHGTRKRT